MMNKYLAILCLAVIPLAGFSESAKPQFTEEQLAKLKSAEEEYKDNPAKMKLINQFKEKLGITDEPVAKEPPPPPPLKHITTTDGSMESANGAYARGDYATALEQYKAMAAQGNPEANIYVGMMYEAGMGTEPDMAKAGAWYKRAAESDPDDPKYSKLVNEETIKDYKNSRMSGEDIANAKVINQEINSEINRVRGEDPSEYRPIEYSDTETRGRVTDGTSSSVSPIDQVIDQSIPKQAKTRNMSKQAPKTTLFKPEKSDHIQYLRPESHTEHHHPEKFIREPELNTIEKS
jgi:hypothetical protein